LQFDLPCYTISGARFFRGRQPATTAVLYSFTPTLRQRLFYRCCLYHLTVEIAVSQTRVRFRSADETSLSAKKLKRPQHRMAWEFGLTPEQGQQLLALPKTIARPIYWHPGFMRAWRWLSGKSNKT